MSKQSESAVDYIVSLIDGFTKVGPFQIRWDGPGNTVGKILNSTLKINGEPVDVDEQIIKSGDVIEIPELES